MYENSTPPTLRHDAADARHRLARSSAFNVVTPHILDGQLKGNIPIR